MLTYCQFDPEGKKTSVIQNTIYVMQGNAFENVICKMSAIFFGPHCIDQSHVRPFDQWLNDEHIDGSMQERRNSIANALELHLSCTHPSIYSVLLGIICGRILTR